MGRYGPAFRCNYHHLALVLHGGDILEDLLGHSLYCIDGARTEWATTGGQIREADLEGGANAVGACGSRDAALDIATRILRIEELCGGKDGNIGEADRIARNDCCITQETSDWVSIGLRSNVAGEHSSKGQREVDETHFEINFMDLATMGCRDEVCCRHKSARRSRVGRKYLRKAYQDKRTTGLCREERKEERKKESGLPGVLRKN
jgi:hypothetical protein